MYPPARDDEITGLAGYIDQQLTAIRAALYGLTEEQARATPCRSALSVGGLVKHIAYVMRGATGIITGSAPARTYDQEAYQAFSASFSLAEGETVDAVLADFDALRVAYLAAIRAADAGAEYLAPPEPWYGIHDARPANLRYYLQHQVQETARHAGHADIIREQLDGMAVPTLVMTLDGAPANQFFQPYVPQPGTIGA